MRGHGWFVAVSILLAGAVVVGAAPPSGASESAVHTVHPVLHVAPGGLQHSTSSNWAGWADWGSQYNSVSATWRQPAVRCSLLAPSYSAFWVGLDGAGSSSVEQIGTEAECGLLGAASYSAWYEMYPAAPVTFRERIYPGDRIAASVTYRGSGHYTLVLRDVTRGWAESRTQTALGARNASAEVIAEAPSSGAGQVLPLADFRTVAFSSATVNGHPLGSVRAPHKITMMSGTTVKASVSALSYGRSFSVTWRHR